MWTHPAIRGRWRPAVLRSMENPVMRLNRSTISRSSGGHAVRADAGRRGFQFQAMQRIRTRSDAREPRADRCPARRRFLPSHGRRSASTRIGRVTSRCRPGCRRCRWASRRSRTRTTAGSDRRVLQPGAAAQVPPVPPAQRPGHVPAHDPRSIGNPSVCGFLVLTSARPRVRQPVHVPVYAAIEETGLPLAFHAGPTWEDDG